MLSENLFNQTIDSELIKEILFDFHKNGPVNNSHLETLSYLKNTIPKHSKSMKVN